MSYPGGKAGAGVYQRIISEIPPHRVYTEPFLGGAAIMRAMAPAERRVGLDLDRRAVDAARQAPELAGAELIVGDGLAHLERGAWSSEHVVYCDPPYPMATRTSGPIYRHEFTDADHRRFLAAVQIAAAAGARVLVSSYPNAAYAEALAGWRCVEFTGATRGGPRTEALWLSFPAPLELHDYRFLGRDFTDRQRIKRKRARWRRRLQDMEPQERYAILAELASLREAQP